MDKNLYMAEVSSRLRRIFNTVKEGYKPPLAYKHRCEGFMQAGVFLGITTKEELNQHMEEIHQSIFGISIAERRKRKSEKYQEDTIDYGQYDPPTFLR